MNYLELADKVSEYQLVNGVTRSYGQVIQIACILALVILFLGIIAAVYAGELAMLGMALMVAFVICLFVSPLPFTKYNHSIEDKSEELRKLAYDNNISNLQSLVDNVNYLSDKYDSKIDTFRIMYVDNMPSREEYINNILAEFYGGEPVNGNFDYSAEYKELAKALR